MALLAAAQWLHWRAHRDLGASFSAQLELLQGHRLVTSGVYAYVRHPIYAAHLLWGLATPLLLWNWVAGWAMLVTVLVLYLYRRGHEERMMLDQFGDEYREYMDRTGGVFPRRRR